MGRAISPFNAAASPFSGLTPFGRVGHDPSRLLNDFFSFDPFSILRDFTPALTGDAIVREWELKEEDNHYLATALVPGFSAADVKVAVEEGVLVASGEKTAGTNGSEKADQDSKDEAFWSRKWSLSLRLPRDVAMDDIAATVTDGVLTVTIPKSENRPERREITVA